MANINVRIDNETKKQAEEVFTNLGLTASTAINLFYKQVIRTGSIPFELKIDAPNRKTIRAFKEVEKMEKHPQKSKRYKTTGELMVDLLK